MKNPLRKENVEAIYPLTPLQEGMLYHLVSNPRSWNYFEQSELYICGRFDIEIAKQVWNELARRHETLRSAFEYKAASRSLQIILKKKPVEFTCSDISMLAQDAIESHIQEYKIADRNRGFDLKHDSLVRFHVFQLAPGRFCMIWSHPHILLDGWSGDLLQSEFILLYHAYLNGETPVLPPSFSLQTYWDWRDRQNGDQALDYWKSTLEGYDKPVTVPKTYPDAPVHLYDPSEYVFHLSPEQTRVLQQHARQLNVTQNSWLLTIWAVFLQCLNNTDDVLFGTVVSGRPPELPHIEHCVGLLINTLPMRIKVDATQSFSALAQSVHQQAHERTGFDFVALSEIQALSPLRNHLFDHLFVYENYPHLSNDGMQMDVGFSIERSKTFEQAHYHFGVVITPGKQVSFTFHYNALHYSPKTMQRYSEWLLTLVDSALQNEATPIQQLEWIPLSEKQAVLDFSTSRPTPVPDETLSDRWHAQVRNTPSRLAVITDHVSLTYSELNDQAERFAGLLQSRISLSPGDTIAVILPHDHTLPVALLGILKAGAVYLPLSNYPGERLRIILEDSNAVAVVVSPGTKENIHTLTTLPLINMSELETIPEKQCTPISNTPGGPAYMIYTSGSTGEPKGVVLTHRGFINMIDRQRTTFGITEKDRILQFASHSFDASLSEIFKALYSGAALVIASERHRHEANSLVQFLHRHRVTVATLPPSFLHALDQVDLSPLRILITAGEAAVTDDALHYAKSLHYFNAYGPSECSVCTSIHRVNPNSSYPEGIPIGKPIENIQMYILDRNMNLLPRGVAGEICIAGIGLAPGYHHRPEETARSFVRSPFFDGVLYRTGDKGKWLDNGDVMFLGRIDNQIKIRGHRVEPEEIEHVLLRMAEIQSAYIHCDRIEPGRIRLLAYYTSPRKVTDRAIREFLGHHLPPYMIPSHFIPVSEFPRNKNGKIDKNALPLPGSRSMEKISEPETINERILVEVVQSILKVDTVNLVDSFQSMGGDSLSAIRIHAGIQKKGFNLPVQDLMDANTLRTTASKMKPRKDPTPCADVLEAPGTPIQHWFFHMHPTMNHHFSHCIVLTNDQPIDPDKLLQAIESIYQQHGGLRIRFRFANGEFYQWMPQHEKPWFETIYMHAPFDEQAFHNWCDKNASFDVEKGPLFRAFLLRWTECERVVLIAHHLVVDAVSWRILIEDLNTSYHHLLHDEQIHLEPEPITYLQWANALQKWIANNPVENEKPYWEQVDTFAAPLLHGLSEPLQTYHSLNHRSIEIPLDHFISAGMRTDSTTLHNATLAAVCQGMMEWNSSSACRILLSNHGRHPLEPGMVLGKTVGWFTCYYPITISRNGLAFSEWMEQIQQTLSTTPHHGMGYPILKYMNPGKAKQQKLDPYPSDVLFNFIGSRDMDREDHCIKLDINHTYVSIHPDTEFPFLMCLDVSYDAKCLFVELSFPQGLSEECLDHIESSLRFICIEKNSVVTRE